MRDMQNFSYLCQIILKQTFGTAIVYGKEKSFHRHFDTPGLLLYWKCGNKNHEIRTWWIVYVYCLQ